MKVIWILCMIGIICATLLLTKENITALIYFLIPFILFLLPIFTIGYGIYAIRTEEIIISPRRLYNPTKLKGRAAVWLGYMLIILGLSLAISWYPLLFTQVLHKQ